MTNSDLTLKASTLLQTCRYGVLSTLSEAMPGYPFGSLTPYSLDQQGCPVVLISKLAQHTKNIQANPHVSLTIVEEKIDDPQIAKRLTVLANAIQLDRNCEAGKGYISRFPDAVQFLTLGDFEYFKLEIARAYYVGGFGLISWVEADQLLNLTE